MSIATIGKGHMIGNLVGKIYWIASSGCFIRYKSVFIPMSFCRLTFTILTFKERYIGLLVLDALILPGNLKQRLKKAQAMRTELEDIQARLENETKAREDLMARLEIERKAREDLQQHINEVVKRELQDFVKNWRSSN
ncbi:hypothetical protein HanRHA438_Chr11g0486971 [Helianthus annuus]|nr:hypothetical protein HanRHA438_Chr11g0486971 [Helianthus annuus]